MAKRKKHPKLPNGYGSITYFGKGRRNPYGVYPPCTEEYSNGSMKRPKALCYVNDWHVGFAVLTAYKAGTYVPGMEKALQELRSEEEDLSKFTEKILADHNRIHYQDERATNKCPTFSEVYTQFYDFKFNGKKQYSDSSKYSCRAAFLNCESLHDQKMNELTYTDLQEALDNCPLKKSSIELMNILIKQMFKFALAENIVEKNPTDLLRINHEEDDEHGIVFSDKELMKLWEHKSDDIVEVMLIMIYSGYRIGELEVIDIDVKEKCFAGGLKTRTSKDRIVPIHSCIIEIVKKRMKEYGKIIPYKAQTYRKKMYTKLEELGIARHTPHDCRHTFSALCEKYKVNENDRKRMLGHKINDITNDIYGHRTLEELRAEIEKIICCECVANRTAI